MYPDRHTNEPIRSHTVCILVQAILTKKLQHSILVRSQEFYFSNRRTDEHFDVRVASLLKTMNVLNNINTMHL